MAHSTDQTLQTPVNPPETFDALRERIRDRFEELSPHLQRVARLALDQPNMFAVQTIAVIAGTVGVQPSTLIRFAKEFGYDGFSRMQKVFKLRLIEGAPDYREEVYREQVNREQVYREQVHQARESAGGHDDVDQTLGECVDAMTASLERLKSDISAQELAEAVELCASADHIYVAGLRRSRPIATYFAYGMTRLERHCSLLDFGGGMADQQVANMGHDDLLVAFAFTPYSPPVVDVVRDGHLRGLKVIALTDTRSSPLALNSTISFLVDTEVSGQFRPISGAIGLTQALIVGLSGKSIG